eukprot:scaffold182991_cov23-Tisochrysis_lutea.AAC.1
MMGTISFNRHHPEGCRSQQGKTTRVITEPEQVQLQLYVLRALIIEECPSKICTKQCSCNIHARHGFWGHTQLTAASASVSAQQWLRVTPTAIGYGKGNGCRRKTKTHSSGGPTWARGC